MISRIFKTNGFPSHLKHICNLDGRQKCCPLFRGKVCNSQKVVDKHVNGFTSLQGTLWIVCKAVSCILFPFSPSTAPQGSGREESGTPDDQKSFQQTSWPWQKKHFTENQIYSFFSHFLSFSRYVVLSQTCDLFLSYQHCYYHTHTCKTKKNDSHSETLLQVSGVIVYIHPLSLLGDGHCVNILLSLFLPL